MVRHGKYFSDIVASTHLSAQAAWKVQLGKLSVSVWLTI